MQAFAAAGLHGALQDRFLGAGGPSGERVPNSCACY